MFERFTKRARNAVIAARARADAQGVRAVGPEHLLLGVLADADSVAVRVLANLGVDVADTAAELERTTGSDADALRGIGIDLESVRRKVEEDFGPGALEQVDVRGGRRWFGRRNSHRLSWRPAAKKALELSLREALQLKHNYIGTEHLLLGLLATERDPVARLLHRRGVPVDRDRVRDLVRDELRRAA